MTPRCGKVEHAPVSFFFFWLPATEACCAVAGAQGGRHHARAPVTGLAERGWLWHRRAPTSWLQIVHLAAAHLSSTHCSLLCEAPRRLVLGQHSCQGQRPDALRFHVGHAGLVRLPGRTRSPAHLLPAHAEEPVARRNNENLGRLSCKIVSPLVFAHVRSRCDLAYPEWVHPACHRCLSNVLVKSQAVCWFCQAA